MNDLELGLSKRVLNAILASGVITARFAVRPFSKTLERAVTSYVAEDGVMGAIHIPHYWAVYVNDGRQPFSKSKIMIWFRNPLDDPRLSGGYPVTREEIQRGFTRAEWITIIARNREAAKAGLPLPVIFTHRIKNPTQAKRFFDNDGGMRGFVDDANSLGRSVVQEEIKAMLGDDLHIKGELNFSVR